MHSSTSKIKLLIIDIDSVLTPSKIYGKDGLCLGKEFVDHDWTALKRFKVAGVAVEAITGDNWNADILLNRNILFTLSRGVKKEDYLTEICARNNVAPKEIAYIGDDIFDIGLLKAVGFPFAPNDATEDVFNLTSAFQLKGKGGDNVLDELFYHLRDFKLIDHLPFDEEFEEILKLDTLQKF